MFAKLFRALSLGSTQAMKKACCLGTGAISLYGSDEQKQWLDKTRRGEAISAFALSEPRSGSDVAQLDTTAVRDGDGYRLNGEKTWISNGGIADIYTVFARTGEGPGMRTFLTLMCLVIGIPY